MPLIRLARDKRGIDTLYLLHQRRDGRGEPRLRVLYFCAMPQGPHFGRAPLDAGTQRLLERRYPDIDFDWPALLRELEQRRLPPPAVDVHTRRVRPVKADRRLPASDVPVEKPAERGPSAKRRRRRGGSSTPPSGSPAHGDVSPMPPAATLDAPRDAPVAAPIIE